MKIIIPMAGHSRRFTRAGFRDPKPFIDIDGKLMIERVCRMFSPTDEFIFVCQRAHEENPAYQQILKKTVPHAAMIGIDPHEGGPVDSVLQAEPAIDDPEEPVLISYCDFFLQWNYRQFLLKAEQYEGALTVFRGFHPASLGDTYYAYLRADDQLEMLELREKQSFTGNRLEEYASTGVYFFESWQTFKHYAGEVRKDKIHAGTERYVSLLFNPMVRDGKRVSLYEVKKFICWGTPADLEEYRFWSGYFESQCPILKEAEVS